MNQPIKVTKEIADGLDALHVMGGSVTHPHTNALDLLMLDGFIEAAQWTARNPKCYVEAVFHGYIVADVADVD